MSKIDELENKVAKLRRIVHCATEGHRFQIKSQSITNEGYYYLECVKCGEELILHKRELKPQAIALFEKGVLKEE